MEATTKSFQDNARRAIGDAKLQDALGRLSAGFPERRRQAIGRLPEFDALRDEGRKIKEHALENLDFYLERFEAKVREAGGLVHWARDAHEARDIILGICKDAGAATVTKSKSMIGEEIAINEHLERNGIRPVETDLGEYILQLRGEMPSHIIAPAIHLSKSEITEVFREKHTHLDANRPLEEPREILNEARELLRRDFLSADVGLTGANLMVAETGSIAIVTNEGNADLTMSLPRIHVAITSIEKVVPTLEDAAVILRLLARSATGQDISVYTTFATGPKRANDADGPEAFHMVLLDNGRSEMLGGPFHDMLRCIRCAACLNHCPVYKAIGGHAYGWVYSGPMGSVLAPQLLGLDAAADLPSASTLCGRCEDVCPMRIPLPRMLRQWREVQFRQGGGSFVARFGIKTWAAMARRPALYHALAGVGARILAALGGPKRRFTRLPIGRGWTRVRDLLAPEGRTFQALWRDFRRHRGGK